MAVIVKIMGGLASQMHKYAIGRALADKCNSELMLDLSWFNDQLVTDTKRDFHLDKLKTRYTIANIETIRQLKTSYFFLKLSSAAKKVGLKISFLKKTHYIKDFDARNVLLLAAPIYIEGEWFGTINIDRFRESLINDFNLKSEPKESLHTILQEILSTESVAIHVRRGDYITNSAAASFHNLTGIEYYKAAVKHCVSALKNPVFFIFSDDPEWVADAFSNLQERFVYVRNNEPYEDLELMKTCKHQIICNSGFSWFGAWLNKYEGKINIAPKNWVKDAILNEYINADLHRGKIILI